MTSETSINTPKRFWVAAILFIIWNAVGVMNYLTTVTFEAADYLEAGYTAQQAEFMTTGPTWYIAFFAIAIWTGVAGSILFALRKAWAFKAYFVSLVFIIINFAADIFLGSFKVVGTGYLLIMIIVLLVAIVQLWAARQFIMKGILR